MPNLRSNTLDNVSTLELVDEIIKRYKVLKPSTASLDRLTYLIRMVPLVEEARELSRQNSKPIQNK